MIYDRLLYFLLGALLAATFIAGMFFLRFAQKTRDRLFALFAAAFWLLSLNWFCILFIHGEEPRYAALYSLRLVAFLLIIVGIVDKNRARPRG
ncbi:MAG TPA: DUF5985 family protein [Tepidisphaeraceae bacterium]|nr:DUF5985 family protein [Tepidisphaeraceae bacterium]